MNGIEILDAIKTLLSGGCGFLGAGMVIFGAISIGTNVSGGAAGNGAAIAQGVATLIGGVIIAAAAVYFGQLDISWATA